MSAADRYERTLRARELRRNASRPERVLWRHLRNKQLGGLRFRRQHPIGPYFADFCCVSVRLAIEVDGRAHAGERWEHDRLRDAFMRGKGYEVVRIPVGDVSRYLEGVLAMIARVGAERTRALENE